MKWILVILIFVSGLCRSQSIRECDSLIASGIEKMASADYERSLELLTRAASAAQGNGWHRQHFLALNNIGANYYNMLDYGEALRHYLDAYTLSLRYLGPRQEMTALNNIGILYLSDREYAKAEDYMYKAYGLAIKTDNDRKKALYAVNLALVCNATGELGRARHYLDIAMALASENPDVQPQARIALADNYLKSGRLAGAKALASQNLVDADPALPRHRHETLLTLSRIAQKERDLALALHYAHEARTMKIDGQSKIATFEQLAEIHAAAGQFPQALAAKDSVLRFSEEFNRIRNGRTYENNRVKFEIANYRRELQRNLAELESSKNRFYQLFGGGVFLLAVIGWAARSRHISERQKKVILERDNALIKLDLAKKQSDNLALERQIREQQTRALLEEERLRNEIDSRNRKLSAKALYMLERDELIGSLLHDLALVNKPGGDPLVDKQIAKLRSLLRPEGEWEDFVGHFDQANHGMLSVLRQRHPVLTSGDLRYISYVYMNLSHKEIATLLNITPEACRKRKERVCRKLGIADNGSLTAYLSALR